jgi:pimeloyl-ACP methyl ester carboxylesterase
VVHDFLLGQIRKPSLLRLIVVPLIAYVGLGIWLRFYQTRMIFFPPAAIRTTPADLGLPYEKVEIPVGEGTVRGWWIESPQADAPVIMWFYGNASNKGDIVGRAANLYDRGFSSFLFDLRGYGASEGNFPSEASVYKDAQAAWTYLVDERQISPEQIWLYGQSLGGAIALDLASRQSDLGGAIIESSFTSIKDMANTTGVGRLYPTEWILTQRFESLEKVRSLQFPLLFIHGTRDGTVPVEMSEELYATASEPKELLLIPGADHNNVADVGGSEYLEAIAQFVRKHSNTVI